MILIIAAMNEEKEAFLSLCSKVVHKTIKGVEVTEAVISGVDVVVALSGVALVNATYTTTVLSDTYNPKVIINIGSAGGLQPNQAIGDICIATSVRAHDLDIGDTTHNDSRFVCQSDETLVDQAIKAIESLNMNHHQGLIVSGDQFVTHDSYALKRIQTLYTEAVCVEMEGYGVGMVATKLQIPFLLLRSLSDVPLKKDNDMDFETYLPLAAKNSSLICKLVIESI